MSSYASEHRSALADVRAAGAAAVFTLRQAGTHVPTTEQSGAPTTTTVSGYAMEVSGNPKQYEEAKLTQTEAPTLFFVATTYGECPALNSKVTWAGKNWIAKSIAPFRPNGTVIFARIIIGK